MDKPAFRKPKEHFDTETHPSHVTFDDGKAIRRNIPWLHYVEARWDYAEPDTIKMEIGDWVVFLSGHNLGPLFAAIENHTLTRVRALPDFLEDRECEADTFVSEIRFVKPAPPPRKGQLELGLDPK